MENFQGVPKVDERNKDKTEKSVHDSSHLVNNQNKKDQQEIARCCSVIVTIQKKRVVCESLWRIFFGGEGRPLSGQVDFESH